ncbi:MAG: hypothetical protein WAU33_16925 [Candidatus Binataceae bacterium]
MKRKIILAIFLVLGLARPARATITVSDTACTENQTGNTINLPTPATSGGEAFVFLGLLNNGGTGIRITSIANTTGGVNPCTWQEVPNTRIDGYVDMWWCSSATAGSSGNALVTETSGQTFVGGCLITVYEAKSIRDKATALRAYASAAKDSEMAILASELRMRSERRAGEILAEAKIHGDRAAQGGDRRSKSPEGILILPTLEDLRNLYFVRDWFLRGGISAIECSRAMGRCDRVVQGCRCPIRRFSLWLYVLT